MGPKRLPEPKKGPKMTPKIANMIYKCTPKSIKSQNWGPISKKKGNPSSSSLLFRGGGGSNDERARTQR